MSVTQSDYKRILQSVIESNDNAVINVLLMIYERQTAEEQVSEQTIEDNGVGFTGADAEILTSFARQYIERGFLSPKQMSIARDKVKKYWGQVRNILGNDLSTITEPSNVGTQDIEPFPDDLKPLDCNIRCEMSLKKKQLNLTLWEQEEE